MIIAKTTEVYINSTLGTLIRVTAILHTMEEANAHSAATGEGVLLEEFDGNERLIFMADVNDKGIKFDQSDLRTARLRSEAMRHGNTRGGSRFGVPDAFKRS